MATYEDLHTLAGNNILLDRIKVAIIIAADTVLKEDGATVNHANRLVWAKTAFSDPSSQAKSFMYALLAANKDASVVQIEGSTDAQIQSAVDAVVNIFAGE